MALINVEVNKQDEANLRRLMGHIQTNLSPRGLENVMRKDIFLAMRDRVQDRFDNEGDSTVGPWVPLSDATENIRASLGFPADHPINERTGSLRHFVESSHVVSPMATGAELAMPGPFPTPLLETKFRRAQQGKAKGGSKDAKRVVPRRPVLAIGQVEYDLANDRMKMFVDRTLRGQ